MQPTNGDSFYGTVVGDEDAPFRNGPREKHLVLRRLGIQIHRPHYVPASSFQPLNQVIVDARVGEEAERAGHYLPDRRPRYSAFSAS